MGRRAVAIVAAFVVGALCGAVTLAPLAAQRIQRLQLQQGLLVQELSRYRGRLDRLQEQQGWVPPVVIETAEIELLGPDEAVALELHDSLQPLLDGLAGRPLSDIDPYLVYSIFDSRLVELADRHYLLTVRYLILGPQTRVVLAVAEQGQPRRDL